MSKKDNLSPQVVQLAINSYLEALREARGERVAEMTDLCYRKGFFCLRPAGCGKDAPAIPYRLSQIQKMTTELETA
jgi:hypothetical protein